MPTEPGEVPVTARPGALDPARGALRTAKPMTDTPNSPSWCFRLTGRSPAQTVPEVHLPVRAAQALANLLPVLGCGEEAASFAFDRMAQDWQGDHQAGAALGIIGTDERVHETLIRSLSAALPPAERLAERTRAARHFHVRLGRGGTVERLACIAAIDAAVCLILTRLTRPGTPLATAGGATAILRRIRDDEARHVRISRELALARGGSRFAASAGRARVALVAVLMLAADDLEALDFDARWLETAVAPLPIRLLER